MEHKGLRGGAAVLVGLSASVAVAATAAAGAAVLRFADSLKDYSSATAGPFDHASARLQLVDRATGATAVLHVRGVDPSVAGRTFGAHLHDGPCSTDSPAAASGHYNADAHADHVPVVVSRQTEVWLDFTVDDGAGTATASVPFVPQPGTRSVVVHAAETDPHTGTAGARLACLPVEW